MIQLTRIVSDKAHKKTVKIGDLEIGGNKPVIIAGPCAVESEEQIINTALFVKGKGASILRGGAYKPRTSPYSFQGLREIGLQYLKKAAEAADMPVASELLDVRDIDIFSKYVDIIQIGSRSMQNFTLLKEVGGLKMPVILKRSMAATVEEWLNAAEYIAAEGNENIILCERGIRTFETNTRNTLDLSAVPIIKNTSILPIIVDPSHGTGRRDLILPMSLAAIASGADGIMVEVHEYPEIALSDGSQSINLNDFEVLAGKVLKLGAFIKSSDIY